MKTVTIRQLSLDGLDESWRQKSSAASTLNHVVYDPRKGWEGSGGYEHLFEQTGSNPFTSGNEIQSIHWFSQHNGARQFLFWEDGGSLNVFNGSSQSWDVLDTGRHTSDSPWQRTQYANWAGWCYIINGYDQPVRYDGQKLVRCGFDQSPPPPDVMGPNESFDQGTLQDNLGLGALGTTGGTGSRYRYRVTYVNQLGVESPPSDPSDEVYWSNTDENSRKFVGVRLPAGGDHVVARRLYRTQNYHGASDIGEGSNYFLVREFRDNAQMWFVDSLPDHILGRTITPSNYGTWPRGAKYIAFFRGRCFLAGLSEYPDRIVFSGGSFVENFPDLNYLPVGSTKAGEITGLYATKNALVVFKRRGIYLIKSDGQTNETFTAQTLTEDVGCSAPRSLVEIPGAGLVFASNAGVYVLKGALENTGTVTGITNLSESIADKWKDVSRQSIMNACGVLNSKDKEYILSVPMAGSTKCNHSFVFHYEVGGWSERAGLPIGCAVESQDERSAVFFGSNDATNHPGVYTWSRGWLDLHGGVRSSVYESSWIDFGVLFDRISVKHVLLYVVGYQSDISVNYYIDKQYSPQRTTAQVLPAQDPNNKLLTWDTGTWGDGQSWGEASPVVVRFDVEAVCHSFKFRVDSTSRFQIIAFAIDVAPGIRNPIKELNTLIGSSV